MSTLTLWEKWKKFFSSANIIIAVKKEGKPYLIKGRASGALLQDIDAVLHGRKGTAYIYHFGSSSEYYLSFSKTLSLSQQQRLRNVWGVHNP